MDDQISLRCITSDPHMPFDYVKGIQVFIAGKYMIAQISILFRIRCNGVVPL